MSGPCPTAKTFALVALSTFDVLLQCPPALALDPSLDASQYAHTSWKISEGFCKGTIHAIAQTPDGYLWLATEFGLLRFDGVRTVLWQPPPGEHLPSSDIRSLMVAREGTLWLGTAKGLVSWKNGNLSHYPELDGYDVHHLLQDREGTVWASGTVWEAGLSQTDSATLCAINNGGDQCYGRDGSFGSFGVTAIFEDSRGNLWLGAANGLWRWKPGRPKRYSLPELKSYGVGGVIFPPRAFAEVDGGTLLISGPGGIGQFVDGKLEPYPFPSPPPQFREGILFRDRNGAMWIGTFDFGLFHVHQGRIDGFGQSDGLSTNSVENLFEDREGNIWIATRNGLDRFREYAVPTISVNQGLSSPMVRSVLADKDGSVWLATPKGLNRWKNGEVTIYRALGTTERTEGNADAMASPEQKDNGPPSGNRQHATIREIIASGLPDNGVGSLYQEAQGRLWVSTARGLAYFEDGRFVPLRGVHIPSWSLSPVARDSSGNLWMTSNQGLYRLSGGRVAEYLRSEKLGLRGLLSGLLVADPIRGGLWVGSWQGGVVYFKNDKVRESFGSAGGLGAGRVNDLQLDRENTLWAATDGGLSRIKDAHVTTLTSKNGLPCSTVHGVIEDDAYSFWLYMACGLVRIARSELDAWVADPRRQIQVTVFDTSDGVKSHAGVYNFAPRMAKAADGRLWFVTLDGIGVVDPRHLFFNTLPPPVRIEQIKANGKVYDLAAGNTRLRLPPRIRDLWIDYTALSFVVPEKVRFRFKLEGQDNDWREVLNERQVQYSNLAPGSYRFRIAACNNSGVWNEQGDTLVFSVAPAFYQTIWFGSLSVAVMVLILWSFHRLRLHAVERRNRELAVQIAERTAAEEEIRALSDLLINAQEQERTRIARELHDDLNQEIAAISIKLTAIQRQFGDHCPAKELQSVRDHLSQLGNSMRELSHELHPAVLDYCDLPVALSAHCKEFSKLTGVKTVFETSGSFEDAPSAVKLCIYRVAQEALRNVAKHAATESAAVHLARSSNSVILSVCDSGAGFRLDQARSSGGLGLVSIKERVRLVKGTLQVQSVPNRGTTVSIEVPISATLSELTGTS